MDRGTDRIAVVGVSIVRNGIETMSSADNTRPEYSMAMKWFVDLVVQS